ncbi:MAG: NAD-dependent epimerase/dehydratase family protein [Desulfovibrionaceae bacterium]|jgi:UDP-glucose 4-epimerase|nr:NAD-dependent epimerase/dehydratase family protein [Desulfovibrionaceae bacterium]
MPATRSTSARPASAQTATASPSAAGRSLAERPACLVTGCAGFVGSHLCAALLGAGYPVVGVDTFFSGFERNMDEFRTHPDFRFHQRSIAEPGLLADLVRRHPGLAHCFHLAAVVSVPWSMAHAAETMAVNRDATLALHGAARAAGFASFVFAGSAAEYGDLQDLPLAEEAADAATQLSPYGRAKYQASAHVRDAGFGCSLRFFNIFGPRQDPSSPYSGVISRFIDQALARRPLTVHGDGSQSRDFIYVDDVVRCYFLAAGLVDGPGGGPKGAPLTGVFNVGTGRETTVLRLAQAVLAAAAAPGPLEFGPIRPGDIRRSVGDVTRLRERTGFAPRVPLETGIARTVAWLRERRG